MSAMLNAASPPPATPANGDESDVRKSKEKRFQCTTCQRLFARLEHLQRHERTHTNEKPFRCVRCDHRFSRSDLLTRHERLSHKVHKSDDGPSDAANLRKRRRPSEPADPASYAQNDVNSFDYAGSLPLEQSFGSAVEPGRSTEMSGTYSLATLSMAAERAALQDHHYMRQSLPEMPSTTSGAAIMSDMAPTIGADDFVYNAPDFLESLDSLANFMDNGSLGTYSFGSMISAEQPMPFFSPSESLEYSQDLPSLTVFEQPHTNRDENATFSRFGSRLPSLQPEERPPCAQRPRRQRGISDISVKDREGILRQLSTFPHILPPDFRLPSRLALSRYVAAYVNGFHEHLPFLHIPTMSAETCSVEVLLAMAAVGAQYCFEADKGVGLFNAAQAIAMYKIRRRDARLSTLRQAPASEFDDSRSGSRQQSTTGSADMNDAIYGGIGPPRGDGSMSTADQDDIVQTIQALLILMAMATWAKLKEILREALSIQSVLATLVRDDGLAHAPYPDNMTWEQWVRHETTKRTKLIVYCFFNLHCIVYNIPPLILNSELHLHLPCSATEFRATTASKWQEIRQRRPHHPSSFQSSLSRLFTRPGRDVTEHSSSLGNYILIHALIQHIFLTRQSVRYRSPSPSLPADAISSLETALRNWQLGWARNPESSLDPMDPNGPVAFNSTALLRLAYIRLNVDTGPGRALDSRDPSAIARAFRDAPPLKRTTRLARAVLHAAHALSIPVKIGVRLVAVTQTFVWSIQHSLCSLECAFLLSKWLETLAQEPVVPAVSEDERRIARIVRTMLDETEFGVPDAVPLDSPGEAKSLSAGVCRVWATIFRGSQTWAIVDIIGRSLDVYADLLEE